MRGCARVQAMRQDCKTFTAVPEGVPQWIALLPSRCATEGGHGSPHFAAQVRFLQRRDMITKHQFAVHCAGAPVARSFLPHFAAPLGTHNERT